MRNNFKIFLIAFLFINFFNYGEILYKVSGKVVYNGNPVADNLIICEGSDTHFSKEVISDKNGNFQFYVPNGTYRLSLDNAKGWISKEPYKVILVQGKNVKNILFFLEESCTISGYVKYEDNTPVKDAKVIIFNERSFSSRKTNANGFYEINSIGASDNTCIDIYPPASYMVVSVKDFILSEGMKIENLNFKVPKKISIFGKVLDKESKAPLSNINIYVNDKNGKFINIVKSEDNGEFRGYNLSKDKYLIFIYDLIYNFFSAMIEIKEDQIKEILIELEKKEIDIEVEKK